MKNILKQINPFNKVESDNKVLYTIKVLLKTLLVYFVGLILSSIFVIIFQILLGFDPSGEGMDFNVMLLFKYYGYIVTILVFGIFIKKFEKKKLKDIGLNNNIIEIFKGLGFGLITLLSIIIILMIFNQIKFIGINDNINYLMIILFTGAWLVQSALEEIICRGYILNTLKKKLPILPAILISFMFFSVLHFFELFNDGLLLGIIGILNLLLISIIWSILVLKNKNLYSSIGFHFVWNFSLFNIVGLNLSGIDSNISLLNFTSNNSFLAGASYGIESSIITTVILLIIVIIMNKKVKLK